MSAINLLTWEEFIYELSALGFVYDKRSRAWKREDGASASDESLRDIHANWPIMLSAALHLYSEGAKTIYIEFNREGSVFVARLRSEK